MPLFAPGTAPFINTKFLSFSIRVISKFFTVMFSLGRLPGWLAHWREMILENQKINRPRQIYIGENKREV